MPASVRLTRLEARRLAYRGQRLAGPRVGRDQASLRELVRDLGCLQLDPISVVARSHLLVLWSRVGRFPQSRLRRLHEVDHQVFEYWAHAASLVATAHLPIHRYHMRMAYTGERATVRRVRAWLALHQALVEDLLAELDERGPLRSQDLAHYAIDPWAGGGWTDEASVALLLEVLSRAGRVLVARRDGTIRWWDLPERCLPPDAPTEELGEAEVVRRAALVALRALGTATPAQISRHFTRGAYPHLAERLRELVADGEVVPATVEGLRGTWYVHADDLARRRDLAPARLTLLSPFDNLICDRDRTEALWDFRYRLEVYTPVAKRQYGYYVLPVLDGDRLVGRVDAALDPGRTTLVARSIHLEPGVRSSARRTAALRRRFEDLARFAGAAQASMAVLDASASSR